MDTTDQLEFSRGQRLLLLYPHPDDETLATGGFLLRARSAGARVRVIFVTSGDNNPWMQRLYEGRWRLGPEDRKRYGAVRKKEALDALACLGLAAHDARFLDYPDRGLTQLLKEKPGPIIDALVEEITKFRPVLVIAPSRYDWHQDHSALAVLARLALDRVPPGSRPERTLSFLFHGRVTFTDGTRPVQLCLTSEELRRKRLALSRHASQLAFRRTWLFSVLKDREVFIIEEGPQTRCQSYPITPWSVDQAYLKLSVNVRMRTGPRAAMVLSILIPGAGGLRCYQMAMDWRNPTAAILLQPMLEMVGEAVLSGRRDGGFVALPRFLFEDTQRIFVKLDRGLRWYDKGGWLEMAICPGDGYSGNSHGYRGAIRAPFVCGLIPCYNVASTGAQVARAACQYVDHLILVDDGSTDGTLKELLPVAAAGQVTLLVIPFNQGKGHALASGFRYALEKVPFDTLVTLDGDGQHLPQDIPTLVDAWSSGADLVIGERLDLCGMPRRSRFGNRAMTWLVRRLYRDSPSDTQSGFRCYDRAFVREIAGRVLGQRYETELEILLLALRSGVRVRTVKIPTIYREANRSSHFRPIVDSFRILRSLVSSLLRLDAYCKRS